jgi:RNA polymerase sigma-70 factor (ECF subfamily)
MDAATGGEPPLQPYRNYLVFLARTLLDPKLRRKLDPSDVVQEALLRAWRAISQYEGTTEGELLSWLRSILLNTVKDQYRAFSGPTRDVHQEQSWEAALERSSARLEEWLRDSADGPEAKILKEEQLEQIARALNELPEAQRMAFELFYIHGYTLAQLSQEMGRTKKAVAALIARGVKAIRQRMAGDG